MPEPITLHDAIVSLAEEIALNENLTDDVKLRWLDMVKDINAAHSRELLASLDSLSVAMQDAIDALHFTHDEDVPAPTAEEDDLGDDFGDDDQFGDGTDNA